MKGLPVLLIIAILAGFTLGSGIPLGLEKGMSLEEVTTVLGEAPSPYARVGDEIIGHIYRVNPLLAPPEFGLFLVRITPESGLSEIFLHTRPMVQGDIDPKAQYAKLFDLLTSRYGLPLTTPIFPMAGNKIMAGELESITSSWRPQSDGLKEVNLYWLVHKSQNIMNIHYRFDNWQGARGEITPPQDKP